MIVVDALDECDNENHIRMILQLLVEARSLKTVRLRIFITSRPEIPIRHGFLDIPEAEHEDYVLHKISPSIVDHDISIFLEYNLRIIGKERSLGVGWPGEANIRCLVRKASGLFIWAAIACRFIREGKRFAIRRLGTILEGSSSDIIAPEKHLDHCPQALHFHGLHGRREKRAMWHAKNHARKCGDFAFPAFCLLLEHASPSPKRECRSDTG